MTRRSSSNPTKPITEDKRTHPKLGTDPLRPRKTIKQQLEETNPELMSAPEFEKYQRRLAQNSRTAGRRTRVAQRSQAPTRKLPPLCACPLEIPTKPGSDKDRLTPQEIKLYGIEDTYLSICTRYAGLGTVHPGTGYCDQCEERTKRAIGTAQTVSGRTRGPTKRQKNAMTQKELARFHGEVIKNRDVLGQRVDIGPHEALLDEVQRTAGIVEYLSMLIKDLGDAKSEGEEHQVLIQMTKIGMTPSALMQIFQWERNHLINAARAAIACGVAERKVRIAEEQGRMMVFILQAFIHDPDIGLTPGQLMIAPQIMHKHLMALPQETNPHAYIDRLASGNLPQNVQPTSEIPEETK